MRAADLGARRVAIWGIGREGRAAIGFLRQRHPRLPLLVLNDTADCPTLDGLGGNIECAFGKDAIAHAVEHVDVIIKSPGVSLYRAEIEAARRAGAQITSLLNLWFAEQFGLATICVTGTKGKSTTASLIAHILEKLGRRVALVGNIGVPITEIDERAADFAVIEISSYQAADFDGICDIAVLTSLYPEHLDWHNTVENYFRDKANLLSHSKCQIINREAAEQLDNRRWRLEGLFDHESGLHPCGTRIFDGSTSIGEISNPYLSRRHNASNLCAALAVAKAVKIDLPTALVASAGFHGLPHRQQELGELGGVLFVDDSISTIPESTLAALAVYTGRDISVIVGGYDRGIDYGKLAESIVGGCAKAVICLGESGKRIYTLAQEIAARGRNHACAVHRARSMEEAVSLGRRITPPGGVVLLSPAAPSYGQYRDYIERGQDFAAKAGLAGHLDRSHSHSE